MKFLEPLFPAKYLTNVVFRLSTHLGVSASRNAINDMLLSHPAYPSLLSSSDVLHDIGIRNIGIRVQPDQLNHIPCPAIIHVRSRENRADHFTILFKIDNDAATIYNPQKRREELVRLEEFKNIFLGSALVIDDSQPTNNNLKKIVSTKSTMRVNPLQQLVLVPLLIAIYGILEYVSGEFNLTAILLSATSFAGIITTGLLLWYDIDSNNQVIKQICGLSKKTSCEFVLNSKGASVFGISWSMIGGVYFIGYFILLLSTSLNSAPMLSVLSWLSIISFPYTIYSVFYQKYIVKKWCTLCLIVQGIVFFQFVIVIFAPYYTWPYLKKVPYSLTFGTVLIYLILAIATNYLMTILKKLAIKGASHKELYRIKQDRQIFETLLEKNKSISGSLDGLGILLGNPNGTIKIVKICNPYCGPCSSSHKILDEVISENEEVQLQIIFSARNEEEDVRSLPVKHFLAVNEKKGHHQLKAALDFWYHAENKDMAALKRSFPVSDSDRNNQSAAVEAMDEWCKLNEIRFTPTIYVNGFRLPEMYSVKDLKYILRG